MNGFNLSPEQEMLFIALARGHAEAYERGRKAGKELAGRAGDVVITPGRRFVPGQKNADICYVVPEGEEISPELKAEIIACLRDEEHHFSAAIYEVARFFHHQPPIDECKAETITVLFPEGREDFYEQGRTARHLNALYKSLCDTSLCINGESGLEVGLEAPESFLEIFSIAYGDWVKKEGTAIQIDEVWRTAARRLGFLE